MRSVMSLVYVFDIFFLEKYDVYMFIYFREGIYD